MDNYIALGDSITISSYPSLDAGLGTKGKVGAGDLTGLALIRMGHVHKMYNFACDGADILDVYDQIKMLSPTIRLAANIITLTAGGNDISFKGMDLNGNMKRYDETMEKIENAYEQLVEYILDKFPNSMVLVNTLYDPTDGLGELPDCGSWSRIADWYSKGRRQLGDMIRKVYGPSATIFGNKNRILFYDVFKLFDGHGMKEANYNRRWYYTGFLIEPGAVGARELSSAWLGVICEWIAEEQRLPTRRIAFSR